jgi:hypothetical protein
MKCRCIHWVNDVSRAWKATASSTGSTDAMQNGPSDLMVYLLLSVVQWLY